MKVISITAMRHLEKISGVPGPELMLRAGVEAAKLIREEFYRYPDRRRIVIVTGKGNNAGDGVVAALTLAADTALPRPVIAAVSPLEQLSGEAGVYTPMLKDARVDVTNQMDFRQGDLIVDALFGIGVSRDIADPYSEWIRTINESGSPVIALDLPSGLDGDTGEIHGCAVRADVTITFGLPKTGLFRNAGPSICGRLKCADLRISGKIMDSIPADFESFFEADAAKLLPRLPFDAYKNNRGRLLLAAGSARYPGAAKLAVSAALRAGAGFIRLATEASCDFPPPVVLHKDSAEELQGLFSQIDAIAAGPGWGQDQVRKNQLRLIAGSGKPLVLDADGLNTLAQMDKITLPEECILTPHIGEAKRLMPELPESRAEAAQQLAQKYGCIVVLKGPQTITAAPDGRYCVNSSGSPALGVAGSGDVLTGVIGAMLATGMKAYDAARLGVWLHGAAGESVPMRGLQADDLPERIRDIMGKASPIC